MRVIAGTAKSLKLTAPAGNDVRPTTDRIKETLFNILSPRIPGSDFLDLFSGSGAIGIEALSRGAESAVFVDSSRISLNCIKANLEHTHLQERAGVISSDAVSAVNFFKSKGRRFDIIFLDPPYDRGLEKEVICAIAAAGILKEDGLLISEGSARTDYSFVETTGLTVTREKSYGSNKHTFIEYMQ